MIQPTDTVPLPKEVEQLLEELGFESMRRKGYGYRFHYHCKHGDLADHSLRVRHGFRSTQGSVDEQCSIHINFVCSDYTNIYEMYYPASTAVTSVKHYLEMHGYPVTKYLRLKRLQALIS